MPATDRIPLPPRASLRARGESPWPFRARTAAPSLALAVLLLAGCGGKDRGVFAQVPSVVHGAPLLSPPGKGRVVAPLPASAWRSHGFPWPAGAVFDAGARRRRVHPELVTWLGSQPDSARIRVIVGLPDPLRLPRLPIEDALAPDSATRIAARTTTAHLLDSLRTLRRPRAIQDSSWLADRYRARVLESFWIVRAYSVAIRRDDLARLALDRRVSSLVPAVSHERPPGDGPPTRQGRTLVGLAPTSSLAALGYGVGPLALLDSGADRGYPLLKDLPSGALAAPDEPSLDQYEHLSDPAVLLPDPVGDVTDGGHGTYSASILVGTGALGDDFVGATRAHLSLYRIYYDAVAAPPASEALLRTLQAAAGTSGVVGTEVQFDSDIEGVDSDAANQAFASGAAIIAAIGNWGEDDIAAPGCARGALGVGAREMGSNVRAEPNQSWNRSRWHVAKPELQGPTSTGLPYLPDPSELYDYSQTSGAVPYVTAAAFVLRNWLADGPTKVDPGQVYSALIACGENPRPGTKVRFPLKEGVGLVTIPGSGYVWWGCVDAGSFTDVRIPLDEQPGGLSARYQAAIWWQDPEPFLSIPQHADFDLALVSPDGENVYAQSATVRGTFERIEVKVPRSLRGRTPAESPRLRITSGGVGLTPRRVYWTVIGRR